MTAFRKKGKTVKLRKKYTQRSKFIKIHCKALWSYKMHCNARSANSCFQSYNIVGLFITKLHTYIHTFHTLVLSIFYSSIDFVEIMHTTKTNKQHHLDYSFHLRAVTTTTVRSKADNARSSQITNERG